MATESDYNSYKALMAKSPQACELCDKKFDNRFGSIVHNTSHVIIPLLKLQVFYCEICYIYFNSTDDLTTHMSDCHCPVSNHNNDVEYNNKVPEIKLEKLPQLNGTFRVKEEIFKGDEYDLSSEDETLLEIVQRETEIKYIQDDFKNEQEYTDFVNSKLKFEVDHEYSKMLKDFTTDCENMKHCNNKRKTDSGTYGGKKNITNNIVFEEPVEFEFENAISTKVELKSDEEYESIHYSDLMSFGEFCCKYCCGYFPNRFSLIVHETTHIRINKVRRKNLPLCPQCDMYIAGNYRTVQKHEAAVHGTISPNKRLLQTCNTCGLRYRKYLHHMKNYHPEMNELEDSKNNIKDLVEIVQEPGQESIQMPMEVLIDVPIHKRLQKRDWIEKFFTIKVCDLCYLFFKSSSKKVYILKGTFSYNTERPCDECKKIFFKLKTVRIIRRIYKNQLNRGSARNPNAERLKKIQVRLKKINKLGKC